MGLHNRHKPLGILPPRQSSRSTSKTRIGDYWINLRELRQPTPVLLAYNVTKAGIANMVGSLSQDLALQGIRVNSVAPGPIWTPLIPATMSPEMIENFGSNYPIGRAGQPGELAAAYVMLASDEASYISGARIAVTGGQPIL